MQRQMAGGWPKTGLGSVYLPSWSTKRLENRWSCFYFLILNLGETHRLDPRNKHSFWEALVLQLLINMIYPDSKQRKTNRFSSLHGGPSLLQYWAGFGSIRWNAVGARCPAVDLEGENNQGTLEAAWHEASGSTHPPGTQARQVIPLCPSLLCTKFALTPKHPPSRTRGAHWDWYSGWGKKPSLIQESQKNSLKPWAETRLYAMKLFLLDVS